MRRSPNDPWCHYDEKSALFVLVMFAFRRLMNRRKDLLVRRDYAESEVVHRSMLPVRVQIERSGQITCA